MGASCSALQLESRGNILEDHGPMWRDGVDEWWWIGVVLEVGKETGVGNGSHSENGADECMVL